MTYTPNLGRWLQVDPIGLDAGDMNLYRMEGDNPMNATDPSGLLECDDRSTPATKNLVEVGPIIEAYVNGVIAAACKKYPAGTPDAGNKIAEEVYNVLGKNRAKTGVNGGNISLLTEIEYWLKTNLDSNKNQQFQYTFAASRYGVNPVGLLKGKVLAHKTQAAANHSIAPTIRVNGVLMGTDKWGHFFQQGYWIFKKIWMSPRLSVFPLGWKEIGTGFMASSRQLY